MNKKINTNKDRLNNLEKRGKAIIESFNKEFSKIKRINEAWGDDQYQGQEDFYDQMNNQESHQKPEIIIKPTEEIRNGGKMFKIYVNGNDVYEFSSKSFKSFSLPNLEDTFNEALNAGGRRFNSDDIQAIAWEVNTFLMKMRKSGGITEDLNTNEGYEFEVLESTDTEFWLGHSDGEILKVDIDNNSTWTDGDEGDRWTPGEAPMHEMDFEISGIFICDGDYKPVKEVSIEQINKDLYQAIYGQIENELEGSTRSSGPPEPEDFRDERDEHERDIRMNR